MKTLLTKVFLLAFITIAFAWNGKAQNWEWSTNAIGTYPSEVYGITTDQDGNVYTTGYYSDSLAIGDSLLISDYWHKDPFLAKYNANGQFLWAKHFDGNDDEDYGFRMVTNAANEVYMIGTGSWIMDFGNQTDTLREIILAKFDPDGNLLWNKRPMGTPFFIEARDLVLDDQENLLITGGYTNNMVFDDDTISSNGQSDIFLLKLDPSGQTQWLKSFGSAAGDNGEAIDFDAQGNIYLGGVFEDSITINGQQIYGVDEEDPFVMKLDNTGSPLWFQHGGSTADDGLSNVKLDGSGNIFLQGHFKDTKAYFENDTLTSGTNLNETNMLIKYDANGDYQWGKTATGAFSTNKGLSIFPNNQGGCVAIGTIDYEVSFEGDTSLSAGRDNNISTFFAHYNDTGYVTEAFLIPAFKGNDVHKVNDQYYLGGSHFDSLFLGNDVYGEYDNRNPVFGVFTHSFGTDNSTAIAKRHSPLAIQTFPNPTSGIIHLEYTQKLKTPERTLRIYNQVGIEVRDYTIIPGIKGAQTLSLDLSRLPKGMYFIQLTGKEGAQTQKVLKQ